MSNWLVREDILNRREDYLSRVDDYTDYIESYAQMKVAQRNNDNYMKLVDFCDRLIINLDAVTEELKTFGINNKVEYCRGYFRVMIKGKYKYKKCNVHFK